MTTLTNLNHIVTILQQNAAKIGVTLAGLMIAIYAIKIMLTPSNPVTHRSRWEGLTTVLICAGIIACTFALVQFVTGLGGML